MRKKIRIGTRGSALALWQANYVKRLLESLSYEVSLHIIKTKGDVATDLSFDKLEGKGFFTKEIEQALLDDEVDMAVHSMKDLPTTGVEGLIIGAVSERANPADLLILKKDSVLDQKPINIKPGTIIGTSSSRRISQFLEIFPEVVVDQIRGNVPTRIKKIDEGIVDGVILAKAGIDRLDIDLSKYHTWEFHFREMTPAPAQGVLAFQCRKDDRKMREILAKLHHSEVADCTNIERKILNMMDGGCQLPLGAYCYKDDTGNYHCAVSYKSDSMDQVKRLYISQSTKSNIAENIVADLIS